MHLHEDVNSQNYLLHLKCGRNFMLQIMLSPTCFLVNSTELLFVAHYKSYQFCTLIGQF